jgi:Rod binding domain-containing protein
MQLESIGEATTTGQPVDAPSPRLVRAAHEFEGQMMKELLKPLTSDDALTGGDDTDSGTGSGGALGEFASESLGQSLSLHGGFGIADRIIRSLSPSGNQPPATAVTHNLHRDTVMRSSKSLTP